MKLQRNWRAYVGVISQGELLFLFSPRTIRWDFLTIWCFKFGLKFFETVVTSRVEKLGVEVWWILTFNLPSPLSLYENLTMACSLMEVCSWGCHWRVTWLPRGWMLICASTAIHISPHPTYCLGRWIDRRLLSLYMLHWKIFSRRSVVLLLIDHCPIVTRMHDWPVLLYLFPSTNGGYCKYKVKDL